MSGAAALHWPPPLAIRSLPIRRFLDRRLKLHQLRAVDAIASQRSLLKAAPLLGVTQPALTKTLREIEEVVGRRLFERLPRGVEPTEAGRVVLHHARRVLAELHRLEEALNRMDGQTDGSVAVGALPIAANGVLPGVLARLRDLHPQLHVRMQHGRTEELIPMLAAGEIDLVIGRLYAPPIPDGFVRETLWEETITVIARADHPILSRAAPAAADLAGYDLVLPTVAQRLGQDIENALDLLGLATDRALRASSPGLIREMLHGTDLLAVTPPLMFAGDLLRGVLRVVPIAFPTTRRGAGVIYGRDRQNAPAVGTFVEVLRGHIAELAQHGMADITFGDNEQARNDTTRLIVEATAAPGS